VSNHIGWLGGEKGWIDLPRKCSRAASRHATLETKAGRLIRSLRNLLKSAISEKKDGSGHVNVRHRQAKTPSSQDPVSRNDDHIWIVKTG